MTRLSNLLWTFYEGGVKMKSCLITLGLFLLMGCDVLAPLPSMSRADIYQLDNSPDFGIGSYNEGFDFMTGTKKDTANLILSPYSNTEGEVLGVMLYDLTDNKDYRLDFRFEDSHAEASHYYQNYEFLHGSKNYQKRYKFQTGSIVTGNQFRYDTIQAQELKVIKNDIVVYDERILIHVLGTSYRSDGYVNMYFRYRKIKVNED